MQQSHNKFSYQIYHINTQWVQIINNLARWDTWVLRADIKILSLIQSSGGPDRMNPVSHFPRLGSVLSVPFTALYLLAAWQDGQPSCKISRAIHLQRFSSWTSRGRTVTANLYITWKIAVKMEVVMDWCNTTHAYNNTYTKMNLSTVKWAQWDKTHSRELLGPFICVCIALCTIVVHTIAQNRPDNFPSYAPDSHRCCNDVYLREGGSQSLWTKVEVHVEPAL